MRIYKYKTIEASVDEIFNAAFDTPIAGLTITTLEDNGEPVIVGNTMETFTMEPDADPDYVCVFDSTVWMEAWRKS